ncbi:MAG: hypothetical protein EOP90_01490 [Lysobacteraceae bacterium]|nr:MAG: hypothetical protein EOP90_01490 [Xanthomonadaceae bacterium]
MSRALTLGAGIAIALLLGSGPAGAQDAIVDASADADPEQGVAWFGEAWVGYDHVEGLPGGRADFDRWRSRLRIGGSWMPAPAWEVTGSLRLALGSDHNRDNRRNNDNERSDGIGLDRLFVRWHAGEATSVLFGKAPLAFELSPMVWDPDLRPAGATIEHSIALGDYDRLQLGAGWLAGQALYGDESRIAAAQLAWRWHEGAPTSAAILVSYLGFSQLDELARQGLARTNTIVAGRLAEDYRLLDLQLVGRNGTAEWPIEARLDVVHNLGADERRRGVRGSIVAGDAMRARAWEFGYAYQDIERDAVMAAFNSDDWWFHSATHGHMLWAGYGFDDTWSLRASGFHERRDGLVDYTDRLRVDLFARW